MDSLSVEISNAQGEVVRHMKVSAKPGVNRFNWGLERDGVRMPMSPKPKADVPAPPGRPVLPGIYRVKLSYGDFSDETLVTVHPDPRRETKMPLLQAFYQHWDDYNNHVAAATKGMDNLRAAKGQIKMVQNMVNAQITDAAIQQSFQDTAKHFNKQIDSLTFIVMPGPDVQGIYQDPDQLSTKLFQAGVYFSPSFDAPSPPTKAPSKTHLQALEGIKKEIESFVGQVNSFFEKDWKVFESEVEKLKLNISQPIEGVKIE